MANHDITELQERIARLEALTTILLAFPGYDYDPQLVDELQYLIKHSFENEYYPGTQYKELRMFLERLLLSKRRHPNMRSELANRISALERRAEQLGDSERHITEFFHSNTEELRSTIQNVKHYTEEHSKRIGELIDEQFTARTEMHGFFAVQTLGLDTTDVPLSRYLPIRVYLSRDDQITISTVTQAVEKFSAAFGFVIADDFPAQKGSWWKKWFVKTKDVATQPEVIKRLENIERAVELKGIHEIQSKVDKNQAEAVSNMTRALENVPQAALQVGSILLIKTSNPDHGPSIQVRTLTPKEMIHLEKNQRLLSSPKDLLEKLSELSEPD